MPTAKVGAKTKICSKCGKRKPLDRFGKHPGKTDGLQSQCKDCAKEGVYANRLRTGYAYSRWYNRARNRAYSRLAQAHPDEFEMLFTEELEADQ